VNHSQAKYDNKIMILKKEEKAKQLQPKKGLDGY